MAQPEPKTDQPPSSHGSPPAAPALAEAPTEGGRAAARLRRAFLRVVIAAVSLSALLGLTGVVFGFEGELFFRLLMTGISISGYFTLALTHAAAIERRRPPLLPRLGFAVTAPALLIIVLLIWFGEHLDSGGSGIGYLLSEWFGNEWMEKTIGLALLLPIYTACMTLMFLPRHPRGFANRSRWLAVITGTASTAIILYMLLVPNWVSLLPFDDEYLVRALVACLILASSGMLLVPILLKFEGVNQEQPSGTQQLRLRLVCPRCGLDQIQPAGHSACVRCRLGFKIEIEEPLCEHCRYPLDYLEGENCPECGHPVDEAYRKAFLLARELGVGPVTALASTSPTNKTPPPAAPRPAVPDTSPPTTPGQE